MRENSGGAAIPRNIGIKLSRGKYVTFVDADDLIAEHALGVLYNAAEQTNADVVHAERFFLPNGTGEQVNAQTEMLVQTYQAGSLVNEITVETDNIAQRVVDFCQRKYMWNIWGKLFRRDFLIENRIEFAPARSVEDMVFMFSALVCAKNYVRVPDIFYVYRQNPNSITHSTLTVEQQVKRFVSSFARGIKELDKFIDRLPFFKEHPELKMLAINFLMELHMSGEVAVYSSFPAFILEPLVRKEFANESEEGAEIIMTHLFSFINIMRLQLIQAQQDNKKMQRDGPQNNPPLIYIN